MPEIQKDLNGDPDIKALAEKATSIVDTLERRTDGPTADHIDYTAEKIIEDTIQPTNGQPQTKDIEGTTRYAATLSQHSNELDSLIYDGGVSRPAALVAASVVSDPLMQRNEEGYYQRAANIVQRFNPPSNSMSQLLAFRRRKGGWQREPDWYWRID